MPSDDGWREMTYRVYRLDPRTGEEYVLRRGSVRVHESSPAEPAPAHPSVCHCPQHREGVVLDL